MNVLEVIEIIEGLKKNIRFSELKLKLTDKQNEIKVKELEENIKSYTHNLNYYYKLKVK